MDLYIHRSMGKTVKVSSEIKRSRDLEEGGGAGPLSKPRRDHEQGGGAGL